MFAWGENSIGWYCGLGKEIPSPTEIPSNPATSNIKVLAAANNCCFILSIDGSVYCFGTAMIESHGNNSPDMKIIDFKNLKIIDIFAGGEHMVAVTDAGHAYGWGMNKCGQLGRKNSSSKKFVSVPKRITLPGAKKVVQVSCGQKHTLMLLNDGSVYAMGDNSFGQLGREDCVTSSKPVQISSLRGLPIAQVVAGGWHSFCVTVSGQAFSWGRNNFGQLGLGDTDDHNTPCLLKMPNSEAVKYVDAGDYHTALLTEDGCLFTFGSSNKGQLGHDGIAEFEANPKRVYELEGSVVTQVSCGGRHTVAFVPDCKQIFAFGSGAQGQVGQGSIVDFIKVPTIVEGPWQFEFGSLPTNIKQLVVNGNQSFALICSNSEECSMDFRNLETHRSIWSITSALCERVSMIGPDDKLPSDIISKLGFIVSSQSCINASFLSEDHNKTSELCSGLSLMKARQFFSKICRNKHVRKKIKDSLCHNLLPSLMPDPSGIEALRLYFTLLELDLFSNPDYHESLLFPIVDKVAHLSKCCSEILDQWYRSLDPETFVTPIKVCQSCIVATVQKDFNSDDVKKVSPMLHFMQNLNKINDSCDSAIVDFRKFYIPQLYDCHLVEDYGLWLKNPKKFFSFYQYPFVLNTITKTKLLRADAFIQMTDNASHENSDEALFLQFFHAFTGIELPGTMFLGREVRVEIRRDHLVSDALVKISQIENLKLPFRVKFVGEEGWDCGADGAVRKEFFMLVLGELLDPKYGLFHCNEESHLVWFSDYTADCSAKYHLFGILCGLAVYNSEIINTNFPLMLYKKLLGKQPSLYDLKEFKPQVGKSLQQLLEYVEQHGDTVEETFGLVFAINREVSGKIDQVDLIENGKNISVTSENRDQYVDAYVDYIVNRSVEFQYKSFSKGFLKVCDGKALRLFRPEELREMFVGNQDYDWKELENSAKYDKGFSAKHRVVTWFWKVFHSLETEEKRQFVLFLTGSSKIPIVGLRFTLRPLVLNLDAHPVYESPQDSTLQQESVDDYMPVASACFNILALPLYTSKEALEVKLKLAIKTKGFHLL